jgi:hypothetical protein
MLIGFVSIFNPFGIGLIAVVAAGVFPRRRPSGDPALHAGAAKGRRVGPRALRVLVTAAR